MHNSRAGGYLYACGKLYLRVVVVLATFQRAKPPAGGIGFAITIKARSRKVLHDHRRQAFLAHMLRMRTGIYEGIILRIIPE